MGNRIYAEVLGMELLCGNEKYLMSKYIKIDKNVQSTLENLRTQGKASILIAGNGKCIGVIALSDILRPTAKDMVRKLNELSTEIVLLTGDNKKTADYFAKQVGISTVRSELLPHFNRKVKMSA